VFTLIQPVPAFVFLGAVAAREFLFLIQSVALAFWPARLLNYDPAQRRVATVAFLQS
jgi:hypothetical protein